MLNPFLKVEWLKEGRNVRLPMIIIFYNAILAFITILFMFFNAESPHRKRHQNKNHTNLKSAYAKSLFKSRMVKRRKKCPSSDDHYFL